MQKLSAALKQKFGKEAVVGITQRVKAPSYYPNILEVVKEAKEANADCLFNMGAGSLTDATKVISRALANDSTIVDELEPLYADNSTLRDKIFPVMMPIVCIPTLLSTG